MKVKIEESWGEVLKEEFEKDYFKQLTEFVKQEYTTQTIYPAGNHIFRAFDQCSFDKVKVVILGQDPYHGPAKPTDSVFLLKKVFLFRLPWSIFLRRLKTTWVKIFLQTGR